MQRITDLSLPIYDGAPTMPLDPKCAVIVHHKIEHIKYNITQLILSSHQGTHLDAPYHFLPNGKTVDQLDLHKCLGEAEVIDLSESKSRHDLSPHDFKPHLSRIRPGCRLLLRTDWWKKFPKEDYFTDYPRIGIELAKWLVKKKVHMLGLETPSVNPIEWEVVHKILLSSEVVIIEGLAHLNKLKSDRVYFIGLPLRIRGRDGSPIRAVALE